MKRHRKAATLILPLLCGLGAAWPGVAREDAPAAITTDTPEYCDHLQTMIMARAANAAEARRLMAEGRRDCDHGDVRNGIAHLRRALVLLRHTAPRTIEAVAPQR